MGDGNTSPKYSKNAYLKLPRGVEHPKKGSKAPEMEAIARQRGNSHSAHYLPSEIYFLSLETVVFRSSLPVLKSVRINPKEDSHLAPSHLGGLPAIHYLLQC